MVPSSDPVAILPPRDVNVLHWIGPYVSVKLHSPAGPKGLPWSGRLRVGC
jgi:hypothetical protein